MAHSPAQSQTINAYLLQHYGKQPMQTILSTLLNDHGIQISVAGVRMRAHRLNLKGRFYQEQPPRITTIANRTIHRLI